MISSVITHSPKCKVAPAALLELKTACDLFEAAATHGGRAGKFLVSRFTLFVREIRGGWNYPTFCPVSSSPLPWAGKKEVGREGLTTSTTRSSLSSSGALSLLE